jgi:hypothetical protein
MYHRVSREAVDRVRMRSRRLLWLHGLEMVTSPTSPTATVVAANHAFTFVVGVTGHRDLSPTGVTRTREAVRQLLESLQQRLTDVEVQVACGLAEGADQLVADVALDLGIAVQAVLPMPRELYREDFTGEALVAFERLLDDSRVTVHELPLPPGMDGRAASTPGPERDRLYARLGDYLARRSNLLLALWDGQVNGLKGGTGDVLLTYLGASPPDGTFAGELELLPGDDAAAADSSLVIWLRVDRGREQSSLAGSVRYLAGGIGVGRVLSYASEPSTIAARFSALCGHLAEYRNLDGAGKLGPGWSLFDSLEGESLPDTLPSRLRSIDDLYLRVDALALYNQRRSDRTFALFGLMAATMGLLFLLYAKIAALKVFLVGYLALFAGGFLAYRAVSKRLWFSRHLTFRVLAESLRVHFFMALAGTDERKDSSRLLDLTGIRRFPGFGWLLDALRVVVPLSNDPPPSNARRIELVKRLWIDDQAAYFRRKIHGLHAEHERLERIKHGLFVVSFVGVVGLVLFKKLLVGTSVVEGLDLKTVLVFLMGLLPLWLGIWEIYQNKMAVRELLWQYRNQADLFAAAAVRLSSCRDDSAARHILQELADRSLHEVYLWAIHRFHREHEPPSAG